ncbi:MAG: dockerin type I domain-containing protein, partial [Phycisphaerae bacterium]
ACCLSDGAGGGICTLMTEVDCLADPDFIDFVPGVECPINCTPPPPNDDCAAPIGLLGPSVSIPFDSIRASIDPTSPTPGCGAITGDVWYTYQAPCTGTVVITTSGSSFDTLLAVYGNNTPVCPPCPTDNSNELACNDDFDAATTASQVIVPVTFADCLLIRVGGNGLGATGGPGMLTIDCVNTGFGACCDPVTRTCTETMVGGCSPPSVFNPGDVCSELSCPAAPANDDCVAAEVLSGNGLSIPFDTTFATTDPAGPTTFCQGPGGEDLVQDIWFSYTAACTGDVLINTQGSAYDTFIAVYDFSAGAFCPDGNICLILTALSDVACNDDMPGGGTDSEVVVPGVLAGDCLMIRVGGKDLGLGASGGMGILNIGCLTANDGACCDLATRTCTIADAAGCPPPNQFTLGTICSPVVCPQAPANDLCADAEPLNGSVLLAYDTTLATTPPAGPSTACGLPVQDIWYSYSVPCTGNVIIHTAGSGYDTFLAVYDMNGGSGCPDPALCPVLADSELDCNDDFLFNPFSQINVAANAGDCLLIRVGGKDLGLGASGGPGLLTIACVPAGMGACCHADRSCDDLQTPANCVAAGDQFTAGDICSDWTCPPIPANDPCTSAIAIGDGNHPFHTLLTTTDGPPGVPPACAAELTQDIWFSYDATCTGTLTLSLCGHVDYDAAIEVYDGCGCPADFANLIACDDNGCGPGGASEVILPVFMGNCYLIRVGGAGGAAGFGLLSVTCGTATACCPGDLNGDGVLDDTDATGLVAALLNPPMSNTPEFCAADVNEDLFVDGLDIQTFVNQLLAGTGCPPLVSGACCFSDGTCSAGSEADCVGMGGVYQGNSTSCMPNLCPQPPVNDACLNALLLPCNTQMTIDNLLSSTEPTDPVLSCRFPSPGQGVGTVWFTFVATDADALITTCNTASPVSDTIVTVYDSAVCPVSMMNEIACSEDAGGACGRLSQACATGLVVGQTYTILVASFDDASRGAITVELTCPCPRGACCLPDGSCLDVRSDECLALDGVFQGDGVSCTPNPCAPPPLVMDCCAGDLDGSGGVETGDMAGFVAALLNPPLLGTPDFCHADVNADLVVDGEDIADFIPLVIGAVACAPPANDTCLNALTVACDTRVIVDNTLAATDAADPAFSCRAGGAGQGAGSLWFSFVATDVDARINTCGSIHPANDTILAVYDGANCAMLGTELGCSEDAGGLCGRLSDLCVGGLVPGNTYFVQIASFDEASRGFISVDVTCPCP